MKKTLGLLVVAMVLAGAMAAVRILWRNHQLRPRDIPVLMYHNVLKEVGDSVWQVSEEEFARQMEQLDQAGYTTILPEDISRASRGWGWLPEKPVIVTFDDGYEGVMTCAEPILARHGMKAICYAVVGRLGGEGEERTSFDSGPLLSTNELSAMAARGVVAVGSHSMTHSRGNPKRLAAEAAPSRRALKRLGVRTHSYCYPYGQYGHDYMYAALLDAHYHTALACGDEMFHYGTDTNLFAIPRLSVYGGVHGIGIQAVDAAAGTVALTNSGVSIPLRVKVRDAATGREWTGDLQRVGGESASIYQFPPEAFDGPRDIEAWDKAGLFRYYP